MDSYTERDKFIQDQMEAVYNFWQAVNFYRKELGKFDKATVNDGTGYRLTVSLFANFRDAFWHYKRFLRLKDSKDETGAKNQYGEIMEHINRGVIDVFMELLIEMHRVHSRLARTEKAALDKPRITEKEYKKAERLLHISKQGYLRARKALFMFRHRGKEGSVWRPVSGHLDFGNEKDRKDNDTYYKEVLALFTASFENLLEWRKVRKYA